MAMSVDELVGKFVETGKLDRHEAQFLRRNLTKARLEFLATRPEARNKLAKRLFALSNFLFADPAFTNDKRSALPVSTATSVLRSHDGKPSGSFVSGGGVNGTGKSR